MSVRVIPYGWTSSWRGNDIGDQQHIGEIDGGSS